MQTPQPAQEWREECWAGWLWASGGSCISLVHQILAAWVMAQKIFLIGFFYKPVPCKNSNTEKGKSVWARSWVRVNGLFLMCPATEGNHISAVFSFQTLDEQWIFMFSHILSLRTRDYQRYGFFCSVSGHELFQFRRKSFEKSNDK